MFKKHSLILISLLISSCSSKISRSPDTFNANSSTNDLAFTLARVNALSSSKDDKEIIFAMCQLRESKSLMLISAWERPRKIQSILLVNDSIYSAAVNLLAYADKLTAEEKKFSLKYVDESLEFINVNMTSADTPSRIRKNYKMTAQALLELSTQLRK